MTAFNMPAYRRNVRKACAALGNRVPQGYTTCNAENGDFIVHSAHGVVIGRLTVGNFEPFYKSK